MNGVRSISMRKGYLLTALAAAVLLAASSGRANDDADAESERVLVTGTVVSPVGGALVTLLRHHSLSRTTKLRPTF